MTVAKAMKSPGQKLKSPKGNGPATPKLKSPKGKGPATPKGTPSVVKTPKGTPNVAKTPKGTPNVAKTPKGTPNVAKTPKGTPVLAKTPKGTPAAAKTPKGTPAVAKTPKGTPAVAKTPKGTPVVAKSPKGTPNVAKSAAATPKAGTPKVVQPKSLKRPHSDLTTLDKNNIIFRRLRINNVNVKDSATISKIRELLSPYGEIQEIIRDKESLLVVFETSQEARAAQKLNGVLCDGQHVTISHIDAKRLPIDHKVTLYNLPKEFCDHDAWAVFGSCGKIANIGMNRDWRTKQIIRCNLVFETAAGAKAALSMGTKEIHGQQVRILEYQTNIAFPVENTVYIPNLPLGIHEQDLLPFMKKAGPVTGVKISSSDKKRHALIYMTNAADVEKALKLSGSSVKNAPVTITRHKRSPLAQNEKKKPNSLVEIPVKKQKLNNGTTKAQQTKAVAPVKVEDDDDDASDSEASEADEADMLAAFQDRLQKLNDAESGEDDDDDDDDEDEDEDEEDGEDGSEEEDDDEDGSEEDEDGSDDDDEDDDE